MADQKGAPENLPTRPEAEKEPEKTLFGDIAAIIGFILLIVIVIWGLVHLVSLGGNWLSSLSGKPAASVQVSAPSSANSGEAFTVSWKFTPPTGGSYAFLYPCHDGLSFKTTPPQSGAGATYAIPCAAAYSMPVTNNALTVTPQLTGTNSVVTSLSIVFLPNATGTAETAGQVQAATTITILPALANVTTTSTPAKHATMRHLAYTGPADLAVSNISGNVDTSGNATVSFTIKNVGGSPTGTYYFSASLPTQSASYVSPMQSSLDPGDSMVNTLSFGPVNQGGGAFSVTVIPGGADANAANNSASTVLSGSYNGTYNYNNGYPTPATYTNYYGTNGVYYPNTYPYTPQPCGNYNAYNSPCQQNQPLYYTSNSQPYYTYPYNQYQPYYYTTP
jgi:hypothetical protein